MAKRNSIFRKMTELLKTEAGKSESEAEELARQTMRMRKHHASGQRDHTKPVIIVEDSCLGEPVSCNSTSRFREIDGKCNNLDPNKAYFGAMSTPFRREIGVGKYNPKTDFTIYSDRSLERRGGSSGHDSDGGKSSSLKHEKK